MANTKRVRRGTIWSNLRWIHPKRTGYGTGEQSLRDKLRYFTYRDDRNVKAPRGGRRWVDQGLGGSHREIFEQCKRLISDNRLAWTMMLSPKPRLMMLIEDEADRRTFVENLTEDVIEQWFEARGFVDPQYSYVVHDRATSTDGSQQLHTHVVLPGTVETAGGQERFENHRQDLREFNILVEDLFEHHMDRQLGVAWRQTWQAIQREEALQKYWNSMEWETVPDNMAALAQRLHATGYDPTRIPESIDSPQAFETWLSEQEQQDPDLDTWFGDRI